MPSSKQRARQKWGEITLVKRKLTKKDKAMISEDAIMQNFCVEAKPLLKIGRGNLGAADQVFFFDFFSFRYCPVLFTM